MSVKDEYLSFRSDNGLRTHIFKDRVMLQQFLRDRLENIWAEDPDFENGGLFENYMTGFAFGFAYYDCRPSSYCEEWCYGLRLSAPTDYFMFRLAVITSESFRTGDPRFFTKVRNQLRSLNPPCLKFGHWGDATLEQVPHAAQLVTDFPRTAFWWYTRKKEVAIKVNELRLPNLRAYLSLDPCTDLPTPSEYTFGITYLLGNGQFHKAHDSILKDRRLVAVFLRKHGKFIDDPALYGVADHAKLCEEKNWLSQHHSKGEFLCLTCAGRCNYSTLQ
jgi:hypothetical protein